MSWFITLVALVLAGAASAWALKVRRDENARRAVRVAVLASAIDAEAGELWSATAAAARPASRPERAPHAERSVTPAAQVPVEAALSTPVTLSPATSALFAGEAETPRRSHFAPVLALGALVLIAAIAGATMLAGGAHGTADPAAAAATGDAVHPIELVSMTDRTEQGTVTISGFVRNPQGNAPLERLTAVVFFFDGQGGFLASARALTDFPRLAPGDETPFVVTAPAPRGASRYRVSFRAGDGGLVPHVDRRGGR